MLKVAKISSKSINVWQKIDWASSGGIVRGKWDYKKNESEKEDGR